MFAAASFQRVCRIVCGVFSDGITKGYIRESEIIDRSLFVKIYYVLQNKIASSKAKKLFVSNRWTRAEIEDNEMMVATIFGYKSYNMIQSLSKSSISDLDMLGKVKVIIVFFNPGTITELDSSIEQYASKIADGLSFWGN